jgi:hypothetical protein
MYVTHLKSSSICFVKRSADCPIACRLVIGHWVSFKHTPLVRVASGTKPMDPTLTMIQCLNTRSLFRVATGTSEIPWNEDDIHMSPHFCLLFSAAWGQSVLRLACCLLLRHVHLMHSSDRSRPMGFFEKTDLACRPGPR